MTAASKIIERMRANALDWSISDVETVARSFGLNLRKGGGSHVTVSHPSQEGILTIPARRPVKPIYIRRLVEFVDAVVASGSEPARSKE